MQELLVARRTVEDQTGRRRIFAYSVLVSEACVGETFLCESYGVRVALDGEDRPESCSIPNITTSTQRIDELMERLIRHTVTPAALKDVVEDWAAE